jgi:endonuclease YncB( thermonuclease family)
MNVGRYLFSFVLLLLSISPSRATEFTGRVVSIKDGDTIEVLHNRRADRIRLTGIDCPEKKQAFGQRAKQATSTMSFGQTVTIHSTGKDRYERILDTVVLPSGRNLNQELVKAGWYWWYRKHAPGDAVIEGLENEAREARKGLWADLHPIPPWKWRNKGIAGGGR